MYIILTSLPHNPAGADKSEGLGGQRREDEEDEKKEAEERSKRREHPHGVKVSTSVGSLANQNSLKHNGCARLQHANGPNYSTAAFK